MTKKGFAVLCSIFLLISTCAMGTDYLGIAEPVAKGGLKTEEIEGVWGLLEVAVNSTEYTVISRAALKQMLTEIGLQTSSDLVNMNSAQKARLGEVSGIKYLLVTEISKLGSRYVCSMRILNASTGEIDQQRTASMIVRSIDELADQLESTVQKLLSDGQAAQVATQQFTCSTKTLQRSAILAPIVQVKTAPSYLPNSFNTNMENGLLTNGARLQNLQNVSKILARNNIDALYELEPKTFVRVGKLLEVQTLLQATITRFEVVSIKRYIEETGATRINVVGSLDGDVRVISAQTGELLASIPFANKIDFGRLPTSYTVNWTPDDYGQELIKRTVNEKIVPQLIGKSR